MSEYMVRWKRAARQPWYYLPQVFTTPTEARNRVPATMDSNQFYKIEVVKITVDSVWESETNDVQGSAVEQANHPTG